MKSNSDDRYVRVDGYAAHVKGLDFTPQIWAVFGQLDKARTASEIAAALKVQEDAVNYAFRRLVDGKLIRKQVVAPPAPAKAAAPVKAPTSAGPIVKPANAAAPEKPAAKSALPTFVTLTKTTVPAPVEVGPAQVSLRLVSPRADWDAAKPVVNLRMGGPITADSGKPWRLRPVLDAIEASAGGGKAGQLLVYKVFLQLPADLLKAAGLQSPSSVDPQFSVVDPRLRAAVVDATRRHANLDAAALATA